MNGDLVGLLAGLYPSEPEVRVLLQRASLEAPFANFPGDAHGVWGGILAEAEKRGKIGRIIYRASENFPQRREEFKRAEWQWYQRRQGAEPASEPSSSSINPPPGLAPAHYRDRVVETRIVGHFLQDEAKRLLIVMGRGGIGKTTMVCRLLRSLEKGRLPDDGGPLRVKGIVYLSAVGSRRITFPNLFADLCRLVPAEAARDLGILLNNSLARIDVKMQALLAAFPGEGTVLLLDNFEDLINPETFALRDPELDEALRALLEAPHHGVKVISTTRVPPSPLMQVQTPRQTHLLLDAGLPREYAETVLRAMDVDGTLGLKTATPELLAEACKRTHGFPKALEALFAILSADRSTTLQEILDDTASVQFEHVIKVLVGEAFNRLDANAQRVVQALAIYGRPVPPAAVGYLLHSHLPGVDTTPVLKRLVNMQFARKESGLYYLHPTDRDYALSLVPRGDPWDRQEPGVPKFTQIALLRRAADYFQHARKPREEWRQFEAVGPLLAEFELRRDGGDFDAAGSVLTEIDIDHLSLWGRNGLVNDLYEGLLGSAAGPTFRALSPADVADPETWAVGAVEDGGLWEGCRVRNVELRPRCLFGLGVARFYLGRYREAIFAFVLARALAGKAGDRRLEGMCLNYLGSCAFYLGRILPAIRYEEDALSLAEGLADGPDKLRLLMSANGRLGTCNGFVGRTERAVECMRLAWDAARQLGDRRAENLYLDLRGLYHCYQGETDEALRLLDEALQIARQLNDWYGVSLHWCNTIEVRVARREFDEAVRLSDSLRASYSLLSPVIGSWSNVDRAVSLLYNGDLAGARAAAEDARKHDVPLNNYYSAAVHGLVALRQGDRTAARVAFEESGRQADAMLRQCDVNFRAWLAKGLSLAGLALCDDDSRKVGAAVEAYRAAFKITKSPGHVLRSEILLGCLAPADGKGRLAELRAALEG